MTSKLLRQKNSVDFRTIASLGCIVLCLVMIIFGKEIKDGVYKGFLLSFQTIIPTLFPFFVISDLWAAFFHLKPNSIFCRGFRKLFRISEVALTPFACGLVCGFPIGVKMASELYQNRAITKNEFERFCGFANNPSAAFIISGVGLGLLGNIYYGIALYLSVVISALTIGVLFHDKSTKLVKQAEISRQSFDFVASVKSAGISSLHVSSYIIFFSAIIGLLNSLTKNELTISVISSLLEVSNAVSAIAACSILDIDVKLIFISFAISFSGFSVHMQAFSFMPKEISRIKYLVLKLCQGVVSSLITFIFILFAN